MKINLERTKSLIKKNWIWIIFLLAMIGFIAILEDVLEPEIMKLDTIVHNILVENLRSDRMTSIMKIITNLGGVYTVIIISIVIAIITRKKKICLGVLGNLALISGLNVMLKNIIQRERPIGYRLIVESGYSFPSGHSMVSTAFYGFIFYLIFVNVKNKYVKYTLCTLIGLLIPLIAISRVYLGVHYASDVVAGFLLSIAYLVCYITMYNSIKFIKKPKRSDI